MVTTRAERPFVLRSVAYTIVSVMLLFAVLPLAAHLAGRRLANPWPAWPGQRAAGFIIAAGGLASYLWCAFWLMRNGRGPYIEFDPPTQLVTTGPYRVVRNPVVLAVLATTLGEAIYWGSPGIAALFLLIILVTHVQVVRIEEPLLRRRFGDEYERYCNDVPRWLPSRRRR